MMLNVVLISLVATIVFGLSDSIFFLAGENTLQKLLLEKVSFFDENMAELFTGALSSAVAIFIAMGVKELLKKKFEIIENPFIDSAGILIGGIIVIAIYYLITKLQNNNSGSGSEEEEDE